MFLCVKKKKNYTQRLNQLVKIVKLNKNEIAIDNNFVKANTKNKRRFHI